jgi:glycosyltransferase involved in cell wall biosynthesis
LLYATGLLAPRPDAVIPAPLSPASGGGLAVAGELDRASGLGEAARLMLAGLAHLGVAAWPVPLGTPLLHRGPTAPVSWPPALVPLLLHANPPQLPLALLRLGRHRLRGRRIIGYWAWELPSLPPAWRAGSRFVHEVWTLSRFCADALEPLLPGRVRVVPPPLAIARPRASALDRVDFGLPADCVVVLVSFSLASSFARKNPLAAIRAFRAAFGDRVDRLLVLKIIDPGHHPADFKAILAAVAGATNIRLETRTLPAADSLALTRNADIVLSLHRSEGFGLVPAEAMFLGRVVVATGWSGNMDFMDADSAALVDYRLVPARDPRGVFEAPGAVWAEPDVDQAAAHLRRLAQDPAERAAMGARARQMVVSRLGAAPLAAALRALGLLA